LPRAQPVETEARCFFQFGFEEMIGDDQRHRPIAGQKPLGVIEERRPPWVCGLSSRPARVLLRLSGLPRLTSCWRLPWPFRGRELPRCTQLRGTLCHLAWTLPRISIPFPSLDASLVTRFLVTTKAQSARNGLRCTGAFRLLPLPVRRRRNPDDIARLSWAPAGGGLTGWGYVSSSRNRPASRSRSDARRCGGYRRPDGRGDHLGMLLTLSTARVA